MNAVTSLVLYGGSEFTAAYVFRPTTLIPVYDQSGTFAAAVFAETGTALYRGLDSLGWRGLNAPETSAQTAFGGLLDTVSNVFGTLLTGKQDDAGTLYRRNRAYDPMTGRFTQEDPLGLIGGLNAYAYAAGDPINFNDPYGLDTCEVIAQYAGGEFSGFGGPCGGDDPFTDSMFCRYAMQDDDAEKESGDSGESDARAESGDCGGGGQSTSSPPSSGGGPAPATAAPAQTCNQAAFGALLAFAEDASWLIGGKEVLVGAQGAKQIAGRLLAHWMTQASPGTTGGSMAVWAGVQSSHAVLAGENPSTWGGWGAFFRDNTPVLNTISKVKNEYNVCMGPAK